MIKYFIGDVVKYRTHENSYLDAVVLFYDAKDSEAELLVIHPNGPIYERVNDVPEGISYGEFQGK